MMNHKEIQNEVIKKYRIDLCDGTRCKDGDWSRTHAHPKQRRVCKWKQANSIQSTFTLLHEIGHIETKQSWMRRAESEYHATVWAINECKRYGLEIPEKTIKEYQDYIDMEKDRGIRRGGKGYAELKLPTDITANESPKQKHQKATSYKLGWKASGQWNYKQFSSEASLISALAEIVLIADKVSITPIKQRFTLQ